jgi:hypothetical protein
MHVQKVTYHVIDKENFLKEDIQNWKRKIVQKKRKNDAYNSDPDKWHHLLNTIAIFGRKNSSVRDPYMDLQDQHVFGPPGSGSIL